MASLVGELVHNWVLDEEMLGDLKQKVNVYAFVFYNISQQNFAVLLILSSSFEL